MVPFNSVNAEHRISISNLSPGQRVIGMASGDSKQMIAWFLRDTNPPNDGSGVVTPTITFKQFEGRDLNCPPNWVCPIYEVIWFNDITGDIIIIDLIEGPQPAYFDIVRPSPPFEKHIAVLIKALF